MSKHQPQRPPAATMHQRAMAEIDEQYGSAGRWSGHDRPTVTAARPQWQPPVIKGSGPWATPDPVPAEEPTGELIDYVPDMPTVSGVDPALLAPPPTDPEDPTP